jgi:hypothetical protein
MPVPLRAAVLLRKEEVVHLQSWCPCCSNAAYGDRQQYKNMYRQAYQQGYQQGYNGGSFRR